MPIVSSTVLLEKSTGVFSIGFKDEDGVAVIPNEGTVTWSLVSPNGSIVNGREDIPVSSTNPILIVISGNDLALETSFSKEQRYLIVKAEYNSTSGNNLPLIETVEFTIANLIGV